MRILNAVEKEAFDSPPAFNSAQRKQFFDLPRAVWERAAQLRTPTNQVCFVLSCGYFKATKRFFAPRAFHARDVEYVTARLSLPPHTIDIDHYDKQSIARHQKFILQHYGFGPFDDEAKSFLECEIETMVRSQLKPRLILWRCVDVLIREKVQVPVYFRLADIILAAINRRKQALADLIEETLSPDTRSLLDTLFVQSASLDSEPVISATAAYRLTLLKKLSQSTRPSKVKERVTDLALLSELHGGLTSVLDTIGLTHEGMRYFANSVIKSEIFQVARRADHDRYLHVVAFVAHQYCRLQDNLVDSLLTSLQSFQNSAQREHKEQSYARREERNRAVKALMNCLDEQFLGTLRAIESIAGDPSLSDATKIERIRMALGAVDGDRGKLEDELSALRAELAPELSQQDYYAVLEAKSVRLQNRVSPILKALTFHAESSAAGLLNAIEHFKAKDGAVDKQAPLDFLDDDERKAVTEAGRGFRLSLYKVLLFSHVRTAIKSGNLNLEHSYKYRALDDYLISRTRWERDKTQLLARAGMHDLTDPKQILGTLDELLYAQYQKTNRNIDEGTNPYVTFGKTGLFQVKTPKQDEVDTASLQSFFPEQRYVPLLEVLATVNRYSEFADEFQHWQQRYHRAPPPRKTFYAGVIGLGCGIGTRKIARISRQLEEPELEHTVNWYFSPENTQAANDKVLRLMDRLELPDIYRRKADALHTSSDGQKFTVSADSLNANYSFKYFGKDQGVTVHSFIDERHLLFHSTVFSAAERESAYVIDGLMHNDVVKSDIHSTDSHGYSEAVFGTTHLLGFSYAPRIKNLKKQKLYIFKSRRGIDRSSWSIAPAGYVNDQVVIENWDDILRMIVTIKLKEVTASDLFHRLNSYSNQHALYRAIKAFGQIIKSLFILRYVDELELRQAIEHQLSKIEQSHRFARAVSVGSPREFVQAEKQEQEVAEGCKRLIKNCIICWNYLYLTQRAADAENALERETLLEAIKHGSVISWRHINLLGEYDFSDERLEDSVGIKPPKLAA
jgi:TnpA family transposase